MTPQDRYSGLDRLLHDIAFANLDLQQDLSGLEDRIFAQRLAAASTKRAVFIASLPRAGTTVLLEALAGSGRFASHTYRDMPFVLNPLLWDAASRRFRSRDKQQDRAHGDGIAIGYDSPESLEEIVWQRFFPDHYGKESVRPWQADEDAPGFRSFFESHMRKIVVLRGNGGRRYVSKNNWNIARFRLLNRLFADASVVVPIRRPLDQALSLLVQHLRFLDIHAQSAFSRRYMRWLGHREFGADLAPIGFENFSGGDPRSLEFWLRYWIAAHERIMADRSFLVLVSFEALGSRPSATLAALAETLGERADLFETAAGRFRPMPVNEAVAGSEIPRLLARADEIHAELAADALGGSAV